MKSEIVKDLSKERDVLMNILDRLNNRLISYIEPIEELLDTRNIKYSRCIDNVSIDVDEGTVLISFDYLHPDDDNGEYMLFPISYLDMTEQEILDAEKLRKIQERKDKMELVNDYLLNRFKE